MKTYLSLLALVALASAEEPILPRVNSTHLPRLQQIQPMKDLQKPAAVQADASGLEVESPGKQSIVLHDGRNWTLIPNGAVIFIPDALKNRVDAKPIGTLLAWTDFFVKNRGWITTNDVSFDQAAGTEPIPAARVAFWAKQDKIVIAVRQTAPISVTLAAQTKTGSTKTTQFNIRNSL